MLRTSVYLLIPAGIAVLSGCSAASAIGAVGTTVTNAAYNEAERRNRPSYVSYEQRAREVSEANLRLGVAYLQNGQLDKALEKLERARAAKHDNPQVYNALGLLHRRMYRDDDAEKYFKHALDLDPDNSSIHNNYGLLLCQNDRFEEAEQHFLTASGNPLYQTPEIALTNAGTCAIENRDMDKAENYFISALNRNANIPPALIQMAEISYDRADYPTARKYLERYIAIHNHTPKSLYLGVKIEEELGNKDIASSYALLLRNRFPDTEEAAQLR
ncbi:MAG: type IV pilus biogenesis/stability protein PilW [Pirellulales bacterium]|nr:type IV pilus biogenesis/stability protein PilW [Pirellulales bacterium]